MDHSATTVFNSPLEAGLRVLALLIESFPQSMDLQKLVFLDFLAVHSQDADGPISLHPPTPHRSAELVLRRDLLEQGALLMMSRGLVSRAFHESGFLYGATEEAGSFFISLKAPYTVALRDRVKWVMATFGANTSEELRGFFNRNLDRWGGEFALASTYEEVAP
ncbi:MAG TPA: ABC-three component system middle component 2 [Fimbriimonas sp.]|nr:ABC-three component system middle component 2 [Fimbriimonas sp.]